MNRYDNERGKKKRMKTSSAHTPALTRSIKNSEKKRNERKNFSDLLRGYGLVHACHLVLGHLIRC
ncbi:hypothetical protein M407DRAFT_179833 [Tulasnella calospora MUT 4182]|uniref:Uncharacterized protein n=1 Tax=Tulasnella calospora MUT 4182 TaxID=1051891 RepID=A0A0C3L499_9AGAM|nr:hypothetical protein M407DRAFT_179833 [Tulasnella calospora MUT 4182]